MTRISLFKSLSLTLAAFAATLAFSPAAHAQSADVNTATAGSSSARPLVTQTVSDSKVAELRTSKPGAVTGSEDLGPIDSGHVIEGMQVVLRRTPEQQEALNLLIQRTTTKGDAWYGKALPVDAFTETFGEANSDILAVTDWLRSEGLTVDMVASGGRSIVFSGPASAVESAFQTEIHNYRASDGTAHFANASGVKVPAALLPVVARVVGLDNFHREGIVGFGGPIVVTPAAKMAKSEAPAARPTSDARSFGTTGDIIREVADSIKPRPDYGTAPTTLTASITPSTVAYGSNTTATVSLSIAFAGPTLPTGQVTFTDADGVLAATVTCTGSSSPLTCSYTWTNPGAAGTSPDTITAYYSGDANYAAASTTTTLTITGVGTRTVYTNAPSNSVSPGTQTVGTSTPQTITFVFFGHTSSYGAFTGSVLVSGSGGIGTISYISDITTCSAYTYISGYTGYKCSVPWAPSASLAAGTYTITASYSGSSTYQSAGISPGTLTVSGAGTTTTTTTVTANPTNISSNNTGTTFTTVTTWTGSGTQATGSVTMSDTYGDTFGTAIFPIAGSLSSSGSGTDSSGNAFNYSCAVNTTAKTVTCTIYDSDLYDPLPNYATYTITATYSGDATYKGSSGTTSVTEVRYTSTTTVSTAFSPLTGTAGTATTSSGKVTITAQSGHGYPTGSLTLTTPALGTVGTLSSISGTGCTTSGSSAEICSASFTIPASAPAGTYPITVTYSGNGTFGGSSATAFNFVNQGTATLSLSPSPITTTYGVTTGITLTASATGTAPGVAPTGVVTFSGSYATYGTLSSTTCTLSSGSCSVTFTPNGTTAAGSYSNIVTATLAASTNYPSTSTTDSLQVNAAAPSGTLTVSNVSSVYGSTTTQTITATASNTKLTGTVTFSVTSPATGSFSGTCTLPGTSPNTCSVNYIPTGTLAVGTYSNDLAASLAASGNYTGTLNSTTNGTLTITKASPSGSLTVSNVSSQYGSTTTQTITATASNTTLTGTVTFGVTSPATGSFSGTCTLPGTSPNSCSVNYIPTGTLAVGTYTGDLTASLVASGNYTGTLNSTTNGTLTITQNTSTAMSVVTISPSTVYPAGTATVSATLTYTGSGSAPGSGNSLIAFTANNNSVSAPSATFSGETCNYSTPHQVTCTATLTPAITDTPTTQYTVTATYTAATNYAGASNTGNWTYGAATVSLSTPTSTAGASPYYNEATTFSTTQTYVGTAPPASTVQFLVKTSGGTLVATVNATCTGSTSPRTCTAAYNWIDTPGSYNVYATEAADTTNGYPAYTSSALAQTLTKAAVGNVTVTATSETYPTAVPVSVSIAFASVADGASAPSGTVNFSLTSGGTVIGSCTLVQSSNTTTGCSTSLSLGVGTYTIYASYAGDTNWFGNSGNSSPITVSQATSSLALSATTPGSAASGVTYTTLNAVMTPAVSGVLVTFTDTSTSTMAAPVTYTGVTDASGTAQITVTNTTTGVAGGINVFSASIAAGSNYSAATSNPVTVYMQGLLVSLSGKHNFSSDPGTVDGTKVGPFGIVVYNFTPYTVNYSFSFNEPNNGFNAFSYVTNCPASLPSGETCNVSFYYAPPYGDGTNTADSGACQGNGIHTCGDYEQATWSIAGTYTDPNTQSLDTAATGIGACSAIAQGGACTGGLGTSRAGLTGFPGIVAGKALLSDSSLISVSPASLTFGPQAPGAVSPTQVITVTNEGGTPVQLSLSSTPPPSSGFTLTNNCPASLAGGASCQILASFSSSASNTASFNIVPGGNTNVQTIVDLTGTVQNATGLTVSSTNHNFGTVATGSSQSFGISIKNTDGSNAHQVTFGTPTGTGSGFTISSNCPASLAANASCTATATYAPTAPGSASLSVTLTSDAPILPGGTDTVTLSVSGTATTTQQFTASTSVHNFGNVPVNSSATNYGVTLNNTTGSTLSLTYGSLTNPAFYVVSSNCGAALANNATCNLVFGFTPTMTGPTQDNGYTITATSGGNPVQLYSLGNPVSGIQLRGTGQ